MGLPGSSLVRAINMYNSSVLTTVALVEFQPPLPYVIPSLFCAFSSLFSDATT